MYQNVYISPKTDYDESVVYIWDDEKGVITIPYSYFDYAYRPDQRGKYTSMYGNKLSRIEQPRWGTEGLFESDVSKETRVLTDLYLDSDTPSTGHRVGIIDIEVDSKGGFAKPEVADKEITAITFYTSTDKHYTAWILDPKGLVTDETVDDVTYVSCPDENTLLRRFIQFYRTYNPTILSGWNIDTYDIPYLYNRYKRVFGSEMAKMLSPIGVVRFNTHRNKYAIAGVSVLDYLALYKKYTYSQQPSYRLDYIGKVEVGEGKVEYEGTLDMLYEHDLPTFLKYNVHDVRIVVKIDLKMKLIELIRFICHLGHVPYEDCLYSSKFIEGTILTYLHRKGIIAPNKPEGGREEFDRQREEGEQGFSGAFVRAPMPGLKKWVYSLDLQSLYPSIIMSLNISPDTKRGKVANWNVERWVRREDERYYIMAGDDDGESAMEMNHAEFAQFLKDSRYSISSNGVLYSNEKVGVIPEILDKWFKERVEFKNLMKKYVKEGDTEMAEFYDRRQHVQKILLNSIYGVLGLPIFRFYDVDNALAVTASGQDVIKTSAKYINAQYKTAGVAPKDEVWVAKYWEILKEEARKKKEPEPPKPSAEDHCIYIDTDSLYFSAVPLMPSGVDPKQFSITTAREMEQKLNTFYDVMARMMFNCETHRFYIKGESVMKTGFWVGKKMYTMKKVYDLETDKDMDKVATKGLAVVRSDTPPAFQKIMKEILTDILEEHEKSVVDKKVLDFRAEMSKMNWMDLAKNTAVKDISSHIDPKATTKKKTIPAHVKASIAYNKMLQVFGVAELHMPIRDGDKIKWTYLKKNPFGLEALALKTYDDPPQVEAIVRDYIDHDALFKAVMAEKAQVYYDAMEWGQIPTKVNQKANQFFIFN